MKSKNWLQRQKQDFYVKKAKKEAIKMVNTLFPAPKINTAINIPIIKQSTIVPDSGYEYISSWEDLKSNSVIV